MKQREGCVGRSYLLASRDITAWAYHLRLEAKFPPLENPPEIVSKSQWIGVSCVYSRDVVFPFGSS